MDPNACLKEALDAMTDGDLDGAASALENLHDWIERGGFPPDYGKIAASLREAEDDEDDES